MELEAWPTDQWQCIVLVQRQVRRDWYAARKEDKSSSLTKKMLRDGTMRFAGVRHAALVSLLT